MQTKKDKTAAEGVIVHCGPKKAQKPQLFYLQCTKKCVLTMC